MKWYHYKYHLSFCWVSEIFILSIVDDSDMLYIWVMIKSSEEFHFLCDVILVNGWIWEYTVVYGGIVKDFKCYLHIYELSQSDTSLKEKTRLVFWKNSAASLPALLTTT